MKNTLSVLFLAAVLFSMTACTITVPYDLDDYGGYRVVLQVQPDDADVLLNGRFIGAAYEFASSRTALTVSSRNNELTIRKPGFLEEAVDLRSYNSRYISLKIILQREKREDFKPAGTPPSAPKDQNGEEPKTEKVLDVPAEAAVLPPPSEKPLTLTAITLTGAPAEAAIYIGGKYWGLFPDSGRIDNLLLKPGKHILELFKPGFKPFKKEFTVKKEKLEIQAVMEKQ